MKKRFVLWAVAVMALGMGVCSCGGSDVEDVTPKEEVHVPVESEFARVWKNYPMSIIMYYPSTKVSWGSFKMQSDTGDAVGGYKECVCFNFALVRDPGSEKWDGRYDLKRMSAQMMSKQYRVTKELTADRDDEKVVGAWVELTRTGNKNKYDQYEYAVHLHVDEVKEENGDYVRDIDVTYTGYVSGGMLTY